MAAHLEMNDGDTAAIRWEYRQAKGKAAVRIDFAVERDYRTSVELNAAKARAAIDADVARLVAVSEPKKDAESVQLVADIGDLAW